MADYYKSCATRKVTIVYHLALLQIGSKVEEDLVVPLGKHARHAAPSCRREIRDPLSQIRESDGDLHK